MMGNPLCSLAAVQSVKRKYGFALSKSLGQNFLIDSSVPEQIALQSGIHKGCGVIEIGPGIGPLTYELASRARRVVAVELDRSLIPVLKDNLASFDNFTIINADILKTNLHELIASEFTSRGLSEIHICANLPYYITTPIVMYLLESGAPFASLTIMVQKEVALRLCAKPGSTDMGAITLSVDYHTQAHYLFDVPPEAFYPAPKVYSAVIQLVKRDRPPVVPQDADFMFSLIKAGYAQRRKTLVNALSHANHSLSKERITSALTSLSLPVDIRGEKLSLEHYAQLSDQLRCC